MDFVMVFGAIFYITDQEEINGLACNGGDRKQKIRHGFVKKGQYERIGN